MRPPLLNSSRVQRRLLDLVWSLQCLGVFFLCSDRGRAESIHEAATFADLDQVQAILATNSQSASSTDTVGATPLHRVVNAQMTYQLLLPLTNRAEFQQYLEVIEAQTADNSLPEVRTSGLLRATEVLMEEIGRDDPLENSPLATYLKGTAPLTNWPAMTSTQITLVNLLLDAGASVDATNALGQSPLHLTAVSAHPSVAAVLMDHGANPRARTATKETPLHGAAVNTDSEMIELLVACGGKVDARAQKGIQPMHTAAARGQLENMEVLHQHGASFRCLDRNLEEPIHKAAYRGHDKVVAFLLAHGSLARSTTLEGISPLHHAAWGGHVATVRLLLESGAPIDAKDVDGYTPLLNAVERGHYEIVRLLLDRGASLDVRSRYDVDALSLATESGNLDTVALLLSSNAPVRTIGRLRITPLDRAAQYGHPSILRLFLEQGYSPTPATLHFAAAGRKMNDLLSQMLRTRSSERVNYRYGSDEDYQAVWEILLGWGLEVDAVDALGMTAFKQACMAGNSKAAEYFLSKGAKWDSTSSMGQSAIHLAAAFGNAEIVNLLANAGADLDAPDSDRFAPINHAATRGNLATLQVLLARGADVDARRAVSSPLHSAIEFGHEEVVEVLLEAHPNLSRTGRTGRTPLEFAISRRQSNIARLLKEAGAK